MNGMRQPAAVLVCLIFICISGCAGSLPPHEELNLAAKKSLDATGLNYSSMSRITRLSIPRQEQPEDSADKRITKYLGTGLDIVRALSVNADGAIDMKAKRSEVLYDLHYDKDNVEVSIKIPLLVDYSTQTVYVGSSFLTTILETVYPQAPATRGKLIRINIAELLQESTASTPELSKLIGENRFSPKNIDVLSEAVKSGILKALAKLDDTCCSDQPLTGQDRAAGVKRRIHVQVGHGDSVNAILDLVDGVSQALFREGVISRNEYDALLMLTDKRTRDGVVDKFTMAMIFDVGIAQSGFVSHVESQLKVSDAKGGYQLGLNNVSSFSNYNTPRFSMNPEPGGIVDLKDLLGTIMADAAQGHGDPTANAGKPGDSEISTGATP